MRLRVPGIPERLAAEAAAFVRELRGLDLAKPPGVAETIDWAQALAALGREEIDAEVVEQTLGSVLKYREDIEAVRDETLVAARRRGPRGRRPVGAVRPATPIVRHVVTFGRVLREVGHRGRARAGSPTRCAALDAVDLTRQEDVYFALRQTLVSRHDELELFDRAFVAWFLRGAGRAARSRRSSAGQLRRPDRGDARVRRGRRRRTTSGRRAARARRVGARAPAREGLRGDDGRGVRARCAGCSRAIARSAAAPDVAPADARSPRRPCSTCGG